MRSVDHIMVRMIEVEPMMELFATRLGLPVSWPLTRTDSATYGWITLGNANLEFWASSSNEDLPAGAVLPLFHGIALEPKSLEESIAALATRGVGCKTPRPYKTRTSEGREVTNFTNSVVLDVSGPLNCVFFCEWGKEGTIFPWTEKLATQDRKAKEMSQLKASGGGILGVTGLLEVRIACPNVAELEAKWLAVSGQERPPVLLDTGVHLSFTAGDELRIESIVVGVHSLAGTRDALDAAGLLGVSSDEECTLCSEACLGLRFRFKESRFALSECTMRSIR